MNVGITTSVIQRGKTGIAQHLFGLLKAFRAAEFSRVQFTLFVLENDVPLFDFAKDRMRIVPVKEKYRPPVRDILWHQTVLPALAGRHRIDLLHTPSYRRMIRAAPCPTMATIHDLAPFRVAKKYDWKRMFYGRFVARRLARRQTAIIAISQNTARDVAAFFSVPQERLTVIHNGIDHARFFPGCRTAAAGEVATRHGISHPFFLYVARLEHPGKNHVRLIEAFNRFKARTKTNWQLVLAGSDWHGAEIIHQAASASPFARDIRRLGFVADGDLPALYRAAGVFIYPSLYEGFGMPPIEAMACGCPVICSDRGSLGEIAGGAARIIDPESVENMDCEMTHVAGDETLRAEMEVLGGLHARQFTWQKAAAKTLELYGRTQTGREAAHAAK